MNKFGISMDAQQRTVRDGQANNYAQATGPKRDGLFWVYLPVVIAVGFGAAALLS